jgi:hypothetical protein
LLLFINIIALVITTEKRYKISGKNISSIFMSNFKI